MSDTSQPRPLTTKALTILYRRILDREPTAQEMEDLRREYESLRRETARALDMARRLP
jgi:hypothetical protein